MKNENFMVTPPSRHVRAQIDYVRLQSADANPVGAEVRCFGFDLFVIASESLTSVRFGLIGPSRNGASFSQLSRYA